MSHDLVAGAVVKRDLPVQNRDERVAIVAHPEEDLAYVGGAFLPELTELCKLHRRERRAFGGSLWTWIIHPVRAGCQAGTHASLNPLTKREAYALRATVTTAARTRRKRRPRR